MKRTSVVSALMVSGFAALAVMLAWRSRSWPLVHDAPILHYIAWRVGEGAVPYRDLFDMNQPGVYLLHLGLLKTFGSGDVAWRIFDVTWLAITMLVIALLAAPWGVAAALGGALTFATYHLAGGSWHAGQRDFLLCLFLLIGVLGVARWLEGRGRLASLACSGAAMGAAITVKPHAGLLATALSVIVVIRATRAVGLRRAMPAALTYTAMGAAAPAAVLGWLTAAGGLGAWREIVFDYLIPLYSRLGREFAWGGLRGRIWIALALGVAMSVTCAAWAGRFGPRHALALLGIGYGVVHYVGQGKDWGYHLYPLAAFVAVLLFAGLDPGLARPRWSAAALVLVLGTTLVLLAMKGVQMGPAGGAHHKVTRVYALERLLASRLRPGDTVQMLDTTDGGAHVLLRLGIRQPTRFVYDFHFFHDVETPIVRALRAELIRGLEARPPRFVVLFKRGWPAGDFDRIQAFPELAALLSSRYEVVGAYSVYRVYAKRQDS